MKVLYVQSEYYLIERKMFEYFENAIEPENRDLEHKVLFPSKTTFKGRRWDGWDKDSRERTIKNCDNRILVTHNDADGLVCGALFLDYFDNIEVINIDYENIENTLEFIAEEGDDIDEIYVSDLNLDEVYNIIDDVENNADKFVWIDHHEWEETAQEIEDMGVEVFINQDRCAAGLVYDYLVDEGYNPDSKTMEIVKLTEDHDLWNHEMEDIRLGSYDICISQVFSQLAFYSDTDKFMKEILDYGKEFMDYEETLLRGDKTEGFLAQIEAEHQMKVQYIVDNETEIKDIGEFKVAFAHGRASPGEILEKLVDEHSIDILVHTKPQYPVKSSIRSTEEFERCHKVAERMGGGGHSQAAGCKPEIVQEPMEFIDYILSHGEQLKQEAEKALRSEIE
jgi:oligoribonuclease NrnB/cAMP/cGMP phosphodiesterase (DHH superfamily)